MADLINRVEQEEITPETASKLGYLANILLRVIEGADFEARIDKLEQEVKDNAKLSGATSDVGVYNPDDEFI
jgi:hypothetical protein